MRGEDRCNPWPATAPPAALAGHGTAVAAQFTLTEGLPAAGLAVISMALAGAARRAGAAAAARAAIVAGLAAALVSLAQFLLGIALAGASGPAAAHALYGAVNQLDGIKMFLLAIVGLAGAASAVLPRWLRYTGIALAAAMICSGVPYLLLWSGGAAAAYVSGPLLLLFITGSGIALGASNPAWSPGTHHPAVAAGLPATAPGSPPSRAP